MSMSEVLGLDGTDYDAFLLVVGGGDGTGAAATGLSAVARFDLGPWTAV